MDNLHFQEILNAGKKLVGNDEFTSKTWGHPSWESASVETAKKELTSGPSTSATPICKPVFFDL